jgi:hypothetical protein
MITAMIEVFALASTLVGWLAPTLPYIVSSTEEAAKAFGTKIGEAAFEKAKTLYGLIRPAFEGRSSALEAMIDASRAPQDKLALAALEQQLRKILADDPGLASRVQSFVDANSASGNIIVAYGERSSATGTVSNSVVITGDNNKVS